MRVLPSLMVLAVLASAACNQAPAWTELAVGKQGDDTVEGAPLDVPSAKLPPVLDGVLNEPVWTSAALLGPFVDPGAGGDARKSPVATMARLTWDARALYVAFVVHDASPVSTFGRDDVDPHVWGASSGTELMLQPGDPGDNKDYYELQVDVNGAVFDSHFDDYNQPISGTGPDKRFGHQDWSSKVERAIQRGRGFWSVEMALPWASLVQGRVAIPPKVGDVWRVELYAFRDGQRRAVAWSSLRGRGNFHKSDRFGRIRFAE